MNQIARRLAKVIVSAAFIPLFLTEPASAGQAESSSLAQFQGTTIDLADGWGPAMACTTDGLGTQCFATEGEMDGYLGSQIIIASDCPSSLRLYSDAGYGGSVLNLTARGLWLHLASYGFDGATSSYFVGGCDSSLADGAGGGGDWYPGPTTAGSSSSAMLAGWNDVISSVFIA